jgi:hypothetical protein
MPFIEAGTSSRAPRINLLNEAATPADLTLAPALAACGLSGLSRSYLDGGDGHAYAGHDHRLLDDLPRPPSVHSLSQSDSPPIYQSMLSNSNGSLLKEYRRQRKSNSLDF